MLNNTALMLLEAGSTADGAVVGVAAEACLLHQHTILETVHTTLVTRDVAGSLDARSGGGRLLDQVAAGGGLLVVIQTLYQSRPAPTTAGARTLSPVGVIPMWWTWVGVAWLGAIRAGVSIALYVQRGPEGTTEEHHTHHLSRPVSISTVHRTRGPGAREPGGGAGVSPGAGAGLRRSLLLVTLSLH